VTFLLFCITVFSAAIWGLVPARSVGLAALHDILLMLSLTPW